MIRLIGGRVITPVGLIEADVWIDGDVVVAVGGEGRLSADRSIDITGMLVGPGFVDLHTHLREPGQTWKEDVKSGSRAAAAGGYTAVVAMPNTEPAIDSPEMVTVVTSAGADAGMVEVSAAGCLTRGRAGTEPVDVEDLYRAGVRLFTDDGDCVADSELLVSLMERVASLEGALVAQHAEEVSLSGGGHMHDGEVARQIGVAGIPSAAEWTVIERDLALAATTGVHYHAQHLSDARSVELVRAAKAAGVKVTAEVTPHHLTFDDSHLSTLDPNLKMYPPIRSASDREALVEGLVTGVIDVVATDHAPHAPEEKAVDFVDAPRGVIGLETAAAAVWEILPDPVRFFDVLSVVPARLGGFNRHGVPVAPGSPANLVVFDPDATWTVTEFLSRSSNSPYQGRTMIGRPVMTIFEGTITHELEETR